MEIISTQSAILRDNLNRCVCVQPKRRPRNSHQMVVRDLQNQYPENATKVTVYKIIYRSRECMAFGFEVRKKNVFPVVTDEQQVCFKVVDVEDKKNIFDETFLFQWGELPYDEKRTLKSVAEPQKYLHVGNWGEVSITEQRDSFFSIQYSQQDKANAANRNRIVDIYGSDKIQENEINKYKNISWKRRSLKRKPSCCEGSLASHTPLRCGDRKNKRMKMKS